jgi:hypothetical protein
MTEEDDRQDDPRRLVADAQRAADYMEEVVGRARALGLPAPGALDICVDAWRGWYRTLDRRGGEP